MSFVRSVALIFFILNSVESPINLAIWFFVRGAYQNPASFPPLDLLNPLHHLLANTKKSI